MAMATLPLIAAAPADAPLSPLALEAIQGRTAGTPVACVDSSNIRNVRIIDESAILYEVGASRLYLNRPGGGRCPWLRPGRMLVTESFGGQTCRKDRVRVIDPPSPQAFGACLLGDFTPYTKAK
jgi:hypothetical protein